MAKLAKWTSGFGRAVSVTAAWMIVLGSASAHERRCGAPRVQGVLDFQAGAAEGVALSERGDVFVGNIQTGEVWLAPRGNFDSASVLTDLIQTENPLTFLLGMDVTSDGTLYVALNALLDPALHGLWKIRPDGTAAMAAAFPTFFQSLINDVAIDRRGNVYASDSIRGAIWRLTPEGQLQVWSDSDLWKGGVHPVFGIPFGVNGLAYHDGALYGAIYLEGRVVRIPIKHDGTAGVPEVVAASPALIGADGIELDAMGNIYIAISDTNTLVRLRHRDMQIETLFSEALSAPASLAVSWNRKVIYVANLSSSAPLPRPSAPALVRATFCLERN